MKSLVFAFLIFSISIGAESLNNQDNQKQSQTTQTSIPSTKSDKTCLASNESGCCMGRGGVCGCSGGRAMCCDSFVSNPPCGCNEK